MMRTQKTSLSLTKIERAWLDRHGSGMSRQLREDIAALQAFKRSRPVYSEARMRVLCDGLRDFVFEPYNAISLPDLLARQIEEADRLTGLGKRNKLDAAALAQAMAKLNPVEAWALVDEIRRRNAEKEN